MTVAARREAAIAAAGLPPVSRETGERLDRFVATLEAWQARQSLVSRSVGEAEIWTRHVADSAQLLAIAPAAKRWLDLGSGGGFPGLVLAALLADVPGAAVHLVESNQRKVAFLRAANRAAGSGAVIHWTWVRNRVSTAAKNLSGPAHSASRLARVAMASDGK